MDNQPLVSVVVLTFNSAQTVLETLNSILNQSYRNMELLIGDDASKDETFEVCKSWLATHGHRFVRTELFRHRCNQGIVGNIDFLCRASAGEWIKPIAGDDCLKPHCLAQNIEFIKLEASKNFEIVFSAVEVVNETGAKLYDFNKAFLKLRSSSLRKQFNLFVQKGCFVPAPSAFIKRVTLESIGFYDRDFRMLEDFSLWLKLTHNAVRFGAFDCVTVQYRLGNGLSSGLAARSTLINCELNAELIAIRSKYILPFVSKLNILFWYEHFILSCRNKVALKVFGNRRTPLSVFILRCLAGFSPNAVAKKISEFF